MEDEKNNPETGDQNDENDENDENETESPPVDGPGGGEDETGLGASSQGSPGDVEGGGASGL